MQLVRFVEADLLFPRRISNVLYKKNSKLTVPISRRSITTSTTVMQEIFVVEKIFVLDKEYEN